MTLTKTPARRPTATHKKRVGAHHKQNPHYTKSYWPYIPIFFVLAVGFVFNNWLNRAHHDVLGYATNVSSQVLLQETNQQRSVKHEGALHINETLSRAAQSKANDMAQKGYWSHVTPDGKQPWYFITAQGYNYSAAGENLAYGFGTSQQIVSAWMQSPEHRANILNADYQEVGFATANIANYQGTGAQTIIVALYATPAPGAAASLPPAGTVLADQSQPVSRLQLVTSATWLQLTLAALGGAAIMVFLLRHGLAWHKVLARGERFALHHPFFDIFLVSLAVMVFLLSPAAGSIL